MNNVRPILFSTPMVQAILEGRKTQTRRVVKPQPLVGLEKVTEDYFFDTHNSGTEPKVFKCPYGAKGDVLWVRETWCLSTPFGPEEYYFGYKVFDGFPLIKAGEEYSYKSPDVWRPSIHMPKDAARIWLGITNVRVERLQDISRQDAAAEGVCFPEGDQLPEWVKRSCWPEENFRSLWQSINGAESWNANPWLWVVEFERIEKPSGV